MLGYEVSTGRTENLQAALVREWVAGNAVVVGRQDQEPDPSGCKRIGGTGQSRFLRPLNVGQEEVDPVDREIAHEAIDGHLPCEMGLLVALPGQVDEGVVLGPDRGLDGAGVHAVQVQVVATDGKVVRVRLHRDQPSDGILCLAQIEKGPEASKLDHYRRVGGPSQALQHGMEGQLFLGLVMASELSDYLGHPRAVIATLADQDPIVHHLNTLAVANDHFAGIGHLGDPVGVANGDRQCDAAPEGLDQRVRVRRHLGCEEAKGYDAGPRGPYTSAWTSAR